MSRLDGKNIAFIAVRGVEQPELTEPWQAVQKAGGQPVLISDKPGAITALKGDWDRGDDFLVDVTLDDADPDDFDALVLPGGTLNADEVRQLEKARDFVRSFMEAGKPVAPICHGAWVLVEIDAVRGRRMTSTGAIATDLKNAGADWVDEAFVRDGNLLTSRNPDDLPVFNKGIVAAFAEA